MQSITGAGDSSGPGCGAGPPVDDSHFARYVSFQQLVFAGGTGGIIAGAASSRCSHRSGPSSQRRERTYGAFETTYDRFLCAVIESEPFCMRCRIRQVQVHLVVSKCSSSSNKSCRDGNRYVHSRLSAIQKGKGAQWFATGRPREAAARAAAANAAYAHSTAAAAAEGTGATAVGSWNANAAAGHHTPAGSAATGATTGSAAAGSAAAGRPAQ